METIETKQEVQKAAINTNLLKLLSLAVKKRKDETRYALSSVYYDAAKNELAATNGRCLIILTLARPLDLVTGLYDILGDCLVTRDEEGMKYAQYNDILPIMDLEKPSGKVDCCLDGGTQKNFINIIARHGIGLDVFLYEKLIKHIEKMRIDLTYWFYDVEKPLAFYYNGESYTMKMLLMPYKIG